MKKVTGKEAYRVWAPIGKKWVDWVRPVPFVAVEDYSKVYNISDFTAPKVEFLEYLCEDIAIIVDLPGEESVREGIALAKKGYRPIPVYNGTIEQQGARATVDNQSVGMALLNATAELSNIVIDDEALPAFLLDRNRLQRFKMEVSLFDNSWDIYPQDIPSPEYLLNNGVNKIIIVADNLAKDLGKVLYDFQKKHIEIFLTNGYEEPKRIKIKARRKSED